MFWSSPSGQRNLLLKIENNWFCVLLFLFFFFFLSVLKEKKSHYDRNNAVHGCHTSPRRRLDDSLRVGSTKLTFVNLVLVKTTFPLNMLSTSGQQQFTAFVACQRQQHMRTTTERTSSHSPSFSFSDLSKAP